MYCKKCRMPLPGDVCPDCGKKHVREIQPEDPCLLTEMNRLWSDMLSDVLSQHSIPFLAESSQGAWLAATLGPFHEDVRLYVPYEYLDQARALTDELFPVAQP